jgi:hypothetical protein
MKRLNVLQASTIVRARPRRAKELLREMYLNGGVNVRSQGDMVLLFGEGMKRHPVYEQFLEHSRGQPPVFVMAGAEVRKEIEEPTTLDTLSALVSWQRRAPKMVGAEVLRGYQRIL